MLLFNSKTKITVLILILICILFWFCTSDLILSTRNWVWFFIFCGLSLVVGGLNYEHSYTQIFFFF